jgi:hypothetical protein
MAGRGFLLHSCDTSGMLVATRSDPEQSLQEILVRSLDVPAPPILPPTLPRPIFDGSLS